MGQTYEISPDHISIREITQIWEDHSGSISLSKNAIKKIKDCRSFLVEKLNDPKAVHYGINTGFGSLCDIRISDDKIEQLQKNLVVSHACGMGDTVPPEIVKLMLLLKVRNMSYGYSGVSLELVERLADLYNLKLYPQVFQLGSLGASGDLAPLAHLSLPLLGLGKVSNGSEFISADKILSSHGLNPIQLYAKEGLALLNGTQFSLAYGIYGVINAERIYHLCNEIAACSIDAFNCDIAPFDKNIHEIRPHHGQIKCAKAIRTHLENSEIISSKKNNVQDPYSFRCIPQVHGASYQAIAHAKNVLETELNSVTDNPNIFVDETKILSGGNFHAQPLALVMDYLALALSELGSIMERRIYLLLSGKRGLPPFLAKDPGINSGMMILQYTAASIVSQNKQLCSPASIDSITSSNGQEDHVSMAANAGTKLYRIVDNLKRLLAIELTVSAQALSFRAPLRSSDFVMNLIKRLRERIDVLEEDRLLHNDLVQAEAFVNELLSESNIA